MFELFRIRADGTGEAEPLFMNDRDKVPHSVAPDGSVLAFRQSDPENGYDIWMLPLDGEGTPVPFVTTPFNETNPRFSPDGEWVAYQSDRSDRMEVYVQAYGEGGGSVQVSTDGGSGPRWAASGRELYHRRQDALLSVLIDVAGGTWR